MSSKPMDVEVVSGTKQDWEPITLKITINSESQFKALWQRTQLASHYISDLSSDSDIPGEWDELQELWDSLENIREERNIT